MPSTNSGGCIPLHGSQGGSKSIRISGQINSTCLVLQYVTVLDHLLASVTNQPEPGRDGTVRVTSQGTFKEPATYWSEAGAVFGSRGARGSTGRSCPRSRCSAPDFVQRSDRSHASTSMPQGSVFVPNRPGSVRHPRNRHVSVSNTSPEKVRLDP